MASVTRPSASDVVSQTGLNRLIEGTTETDFLQALEELVIDGEAECAVAVGESFFDGDSHTDRKAALLKSAVCFRTAARALNLPWLQFATGTHEPLLMDGDRIEAVRQGFRDEAERLEGLATAGIETGSARPFARPAVSSSTFTRSSTDRTPSERNALLDESDDIAADDVENG